jgi:hypothetical protein
MGIKLTRPLLEAVLEQSRQKQRQHMIADMRASLAMRRAVVARLEAGEEFDLVKEWQHILDFDQKHIKARLIPR